MVEAPSEVDNAQLGELRAKGYGDLVSIFAARMVHNIGCGFAHREFHVSAVFVDNANLG